MKQQTQSSKSAGYLNSSHTNGLCILLKQDLRTVPFAALLTVLALCIPAFGSAQLTAAIGNPDANPFHASMPATTLAVFPDPSNSRSIYANLWPVLVNALRIELSANLPQPQIVLYRTSDLPAFTSLDLDIDIVRGDQIDPGIMVNNSVSIYLHGECRILPHPAQAFSLRDHVSGALGWVENSHGHILPFIHVDCDRLAEMLAAKAFGRNSDERNQWMAAAIARVVVHEWIHIATQNPHHADRGIFKPVFSVKDLLENTSKPAPRHGRRLPAASIPSGMDTGELPALDSFLPPSLLGDE